MSTSGGTSSAFATEGLLPALVEVDEEDEEEEEEMPAGLLPQARISGRISGGMRFLRFLRKGMQSPAVSGKEVTPNPPGEADTSPGGFDDRG